MEFSNYTGLLHGDTELEMSTGKSMKLEEVAQRVNRGETLYANSCDPVTFKVLTSKVENVSRNGESVKTVGVRLRNDNVITTTPEHEFLLRTGIYRKAGELKSGDRVMGVFRRGPYVGVSNMEVDSVSETQSDLTFGIEVENFGNIALSAGVFVKNSAKGVK